MNDCAFVRISTGISVGVFEGVPEVISEKNLEEVHGRIPKEFLGNIPDEVLRVFLEGFRRRISRIRTEIPEGIGGGTSRAIPG